MSLAPWTEIPPAGTIVGIDVMRHLDLSDIRDYVLPGGLYAIICEYPSPAGCDVLMISVPRSLLDHPRYRVWSWECSFPCDQSSDGSDYMRLLRVSDEVECAVRALAELSDTLPVIVDDGWLC